MREQLEIEKNEVSREEIQDHITSRAFTFEIEKKPGRQVRCIDGREKRGLGVDEPLPEIARPGAGLGYVLAALGTIKKLNLEGNQRGIKAVEDVLGEGVTLHTDTPHGEEGSLGCAGCGHVMAALEDPEKYGLDERAVGLLKKYIPKLTERQGKRGEETVAYDGGHEEMAVIIIDTENIAVPNMMDSGKAVYVYNQAVDSAILRDIAKQLARQFPKADSAKIEKTIQEIAKLQTNLTVEKLGGKLPKFFVTSQEGNIIVTQSQN